MIFPNNPKSQSLESEFDAKHRGHMTVVDAVKNFDVKLYNIFKGDKQ
jgi:hypothetical protein